MAGLRVSVVIGRFQVPTLHEGQLSILRQAVDAGDLLCVVIGQAPLDGYQAEHPLSFVQRASVIRTHFRDAVILPNPDRKSDVDWSRQLDLLLTETFPNDTITLYAGRDSFKNHYSGVFSVVECESKNPALSGTDIRAAIREQTSVEFMSGQIYALEKQFPHAYAAVDVAVLRKSFGTHSVYETLLIQRADTKEWCFPGGFVDPKDDSYEQAARRELYEETRLSVEGGMRVLGSIRVKDWRYRKCRDQIFTTLHVTTFSFGSMADFNRNEVADMKFVPVKMETIVCDSHLPLWKMVMKECGYEV